MNIVNSFRSISIVKRIVAEVIVIIVLYEELQNVLRNNLIVE